MAGSPSWMDVLPWPSPDSWCLHAEPGSNLNSALDLPQALESDVHRRTLEAWWVEWLRYYFKTVLSSPVKKKVGGGGGFGCIHSVIYPRVDHIQEERQGFTTTHVSCRGRELVADLVWRIFFFLIPPLKSKPAQMSFLSSSFKHVFSFPSFKQH